MRATGVHEPRRGSGVAAIVLAAGAASRFGAAKALALLEGRPLLQHVLDAVGSAGLGRVVVVLGEAADAVEPAIAWRAEHRVVNPVPERGLASSLQVGLAALAEDGDVAAALVVLGDQPRLSPAVICSVIEAWRAGGGPIVVPRYSESGALNPVLLARSVWPLAMTLDGDRGMGPLIHRSPELVTEVAVAGDNPDVDTPADLARLVERSGEEDPGAPSARAIEAGWAQRVRSNRDQVDRVREVADGRDFYAPTSSLFRADPLRTDDPVLDVLAGLARPQDVWLDIGAGAGRFALPIARRVREVIALDPSAGMLDGLRAGMTEHGIANIRVLEGRWPEEADGLRADVALIAHVGYDIEAIGAFVDAMERAAGRLCVAVLMDRAPAALADPFWAGIHGEQRVPLPALPEFLALLLARRRWFELRRVPSPPRRWDGVDDALRFLRQQLWVAPDGEADRRLRALVEALPRDDGGGVQLSTADRDIGIVTWRPE